MINPSVVEVGLRIIDFGDWWFASVSTSRVLQLLVKFSTYIDQLKNGRGHKDRKNAQRIYEQGLDNGIYSPPSDPSERKKYAASLGVDNLLYPDRRMQHRAEKESIRFVILAPSLQEWAQEHGQYVHGFENTDPCSSHWNEFGHRVAGTMIAKHICQLPPLHQTNIE